MPAEAAATGGGLNIMFGVIFGFVWCMMFKYFWSWYQARRWPMVQLVLKEVGDTMPKPILTKCRRDGRMIKSQKGFVKPQNQWKHLMSDMLDICLWRSQNNTYPCVWKEKSPFIKLKKKLPFFQIRRGKNPEKLGIKGEQGTFPVTSVTEDDNYIYIHATDPTKNAKTPDIAPSKDKTLTTGFKGVYNEDKEEADRIMAEDKKGTSTQPPIEVDAVIYTVAFGKMPKELKPIMDETIKDVVIDLWKKNAARFTWKDKIDRLAPMIYPILAFLMIVFFFMMVNKNTKTVADAVRDGIKVTIEGRIPQNVVPPITTFPPRPPGIG